MPSSLSEDNPFRAGVLPETQFLLAGQDLLTGLSSRAGLDAHYRLAVARARRSGARLAIGVAVVEVDPATPPDEVFGHDLVVVEAAKRLRACLRETDLVARVGETRFAFVAEEVSPAGIGAIHERVQRALATPGAQHSALAGGRVGLVLWDNADQTLAALLRSAEETLTAEPRAALAAANAESFGARVDAVGAPPMRSGARQIARRTLGWLALVTLIALGVSAAPATWRNRWLPIDTLAAQGWNELRARLPLALPALRRP